MQTVKGHNFKRITNRPDPIIWVFIDQLVKHCSVNVRRLMSRIAYEKYRL